MSDYRERFFDGVKEHSQIKLRAFSRYLRPWTAKVGSLPRTDRVWIVDGFAGRGRYESGELGSSGIALEHAQATAASGGKVKVAVFFVEKTLPNYRQLRRLRQKYGVEGFVEPGDFWSKVPTIADVVGSEPVFLFVDPFGLGDLDFQSLVNLCNSLPKVDVMINFMSPVARRLAPQRSTLVDRAVGGPGWEVGSVADTFSDRLQKACGFMAPARLPVSSAIGGDLKYEVIMAARHPAAYELWNDEIADHDRAVLDGGTSDEVAIRLSEARMLLEGEAGSRISFSRRELLRVLKVENCGEVHHRVYLRAVEDLILTGRWERAPGPVETARMRNRL